jgi:hypothetical protein
MNNKTKILSIASLLAVVAIIIVLVTSNSGITNIINKPVFVGLYVNNHNVQRLSINSNGTITYLFTKDVWDYNGIDPNRDRNWTASFYASWTQVNATAFNITYTNLDTEHTPYTMLVNMFPIQTSRNGTDITLWNFYDPLYTLTNPQSKSPLVWSLYQQYTS